MLIALLAVLFAVALPGALLVAAVRMARRATTAGRTGDHPHCRRCGYDLVASPQQGRCPECGRELRDRSATVIGRPSTSRPRLAAAGAVALAAVALAALASPPVLRGVDWRAAEPVFLLRRQTARGDVPAALELSRRLAAGSLSDGQMRSSAEAALVVQADPAAKWHRAFGDIVEGARGRGVLGDEAWRAYARHAPQPYLKVPTKARPGELALLELWLDPSRLDGESYPLPNVAGGVRSTDPESSPWPSGDGRFTLWYRLKEYQIASETPLTYDDSWDDNRITCGLPIGDTQKFLASDGYSLSLAIPPDLPAGVATVHVTFDFQTQASSDGRSGHPAKDPPDRTLASWRQTFVLAVDVSPPASTQ